jgi:hypothetical protein
LGLRQPDHARRFQRSQVYHGADFIVRHGVWAPRWHAALSRATAHTRSNRLAIGNYLPFFPVAIMQWSLATYSDLFGLQRRPAICVPFDLDPFNLIEPVGLPVSHRPQDGVERDPHV